jgi:hypothetical protein
LGGLGGEGTACEVMENDAVEENKKNKYVLQLAAGFTVELL